MTTNQTMRLIAAALAAPKTHAVVTTYADGRERRKIGRPLIERETGATVQVVSVAIEVL